MYARASLASGVVAMQGVTTFNDELNSIRYSNLTGRPEGLLIAFTRQ